MNSQVLPLILRSGTDQKHLKDAGSLWIVSVVVTTWKNFHQLVRFLGEFNCILFS